MAGRLTRAAGPRGGTEPERPVTEQALAAFDRARCGEPAGHRGVLTARRRAGSPRPHRSRGRTVACCGGSPVRQWGPRRRSAPPNASPAGSMTVRSAAHRPVEFGPRGG
ncbi:hypothetical protein GCM10023108_24370 [Saccharopolyspora hordei]